MIYEIYVNNDLVVRTEWSPLAQAVWSRATHDQTTGGTIVLQKDGERVCTYDVAGGRGAKWPEEDSCQLSDVVASTVQLLRDDGWDAVQIAEAMSEFGLPTSRSRVDAMRRGNVNVTAVEVVVMLRAVLNKYKSERSTDGAEDVTPRTAALSMRVLTTAIRAVTEGLYETRRTLPPDKMAEMIAAAYQLIVDEERIARPS